MQLTLLIALLSCVSLSVARIVSITGPLNYVPTATSNYPLTFNTGPAPTTNEDLSVAIGLDTSPAHGGAALGNFIRNFDLENTGHGNQNGSFTLQVPLTVDKFTSNGNFVITAAVTSVIGALSNVQISILNLPIIVTGVRPPPAGRLIHPGRDATKCLTAGGATNGSSVTIQNCANSPGQLWNNIGGTLQVTFPQNNTSTTLCLDVTNGSTTNGNPTQVFTCFAGNTNQQWFITGDHRIAWTNRGECLDLRDGNTAPNTVAQMWQCTDNNANQVWNIV